MPYIRQVKPVGMNVLAIEAQGLVADGSTALTSRTHWPPGNISPVCSEAGP